MKELFKLKNPSDYNNGGERGGGQEIFQKERTAGRRNKRPKKAVRQSGVTEAAGKFYQNNFASGS